MTVKAGIYVRISQDREGAGLGVQRQEEDCRTLADRLGWDVAETYVDNDTSAYSGKPRPAYTRLLADIEAGTVGGVLAWHTDRLHRHTRELDDYIDICERRSVATHTVQAGILDLATPSGRMVARVLGAVARMEVEHKGARGKRAHLQAAQNGQWRGGVRPFGFAADGTTVVPAEAAIVQRITRDVIVGRSIGEVVRELNAGGVRTTVGGDWSYTTVRQLVRRPRNAGWSEYRGELLTKGTWEPLVSEEEWRAACAVLGQRRKRTPSGGVKWLLAGIAECSVCRGPLKSAWTDHHLASGPRRVYRCIPHVYRAGEPLDEMVTGAVLALVGSATFRTGISARLAGDGELERLRAEQSALVERRATLAVQATEIGFDLAQIAAMNAALASKLAEVEGRLADAGRGAGPLGPLLAADDPAALWESLSVPQRRVAVQAAVRVVVLPKPAHHPGGNRFDPALVRILPAHIDH